MPPVVTKKRLGIEGPAVEALVVTGDGLAQLRQAALPSVEGFAGGDRARGRRRR
jgi:hypothetical protein